MNDQKRTKAQLIEELGDLRRRVAEQDAQIARSQQAEESQRQISSNLPVLIATAGLDGYYKEVNDAFERTLGWSEQESLSRPFVEFIHPEDRAAAIKTFSQLASGKSVADFVDRNICKDGSHRWISWTVIPVPNRDIVYGIGQDITEKKLAEEERKRAEEELKRGYDGLEQEVKERTADLAIFRRFAEASGQGFGMADMEGRITYMNPALCRLAGVENPEDAIGKHLTTYYPEGYSDRREKEIIPALLRDGHWEGEVVGELCGKEVSVLQHSFLMRDEDGTPTHLASVITDITERKQKEVALRLSEERFRSYFVQGLIGMAVSTPEKRWLEVNDRLCEILGYSHEELRTMKWTEATHPDDVERGLQDFKRITAGEVNHYAQEKRFVRKDGTVVHTNIFVRSFRREDGAVDHFLTLIEDVTERKQAEESLRASEARLAESQRLAHLGSFERDFRTGKAIWSEELYRITGLGPSPSAPSFEEHIQQIHPEDREQVRSHIANTVQNGTPLDITFRFVRPDGNVRYIHSVGERVRDATGQVVKLVGTGLDVTQQKHTEQQLQREQRTLRHLLQSSDHERQLIAYEIHDGLAQYLAGAIMQLDLYHHLRETNPKQAAKAFDAAKTMLQQSHFEARRLISGVRPPIIDEAGIVAAVAHLVNEQKLRNRAEIEFQSKVMFDRLVPILENAIYRIVQEALANACQHSKSQRIVVEMVQDGGQVRLAVEDWGIGFDPEGVEEDCYGLEGIRERARLLGGDCVVQSEPGKGTRIKVDLPVLLRERDK